MSFTAPPTEWTDSISYSGLAHIGFCYWFLYVKC
jgi:hypothetical protein